MRKKTVTFLRYLNGALLITAFLPLITVMLSTMDPSQDRVRIFLTSLIVLVPYVTISAAGAKCKNFGLFLLISLLSVAVTFFVAPTIPEKIVYPLIAIVILMIRGAGRGKEKHDILTQPHLSATLIFVGLYIASLYYHGEFLSSVNYYLTFAYVILVMVFTNLSNLDEYLEVNKETANIPNRQINRSNTVVLGIFILITVAVMFLLPLTGLDKVLSAFFVYIFNGIVYLLKLIRFKRSDAPIEEEDLQPPKPEFPGVNGGAEEAGAMALWVENMFKVLFILILVFLAFMLIRIIVRAIINTVRRFYQPIAENDDIAEFLEPTQEASSVFGRSDRPGLFDRTPNGIVRKQYRRVLESRDKDRAIRTSYTPEELENAAHLEESEDRERLHTLYEKARYSENGVSREEAKEIRRLKV